MQSETNSYYNKSFKLYHFSTAFDNEIECIDNLKMFFKIVNFGRQKRVYVSKRKFQILWIDKTTKINYFTKLSASKLVIKIPIG